MNLEPHPVSGEIEIPNIDTIEYRRLDSETLHARFCLDELHLVPTYLWCMAEGNKAGSSWRVTSLSSLDDKDDSVPWYESIEEAEAEFKLSRGANLTNGSIRLGHDNDMDNDGDGDGDDDDDDDGAYWAAYDMTPGRTPNKRSPAPSSKLNSLTTQASSKSEMDYFERYVTEVQPAMDPYDASEDTHDQPSSTLNHHRHEFAKAESPTLSTNGNGVGNNDGRAANVPVELVISVPDSPHHPQPSSASSPRSIRALEEQAEGHSQIEVGIRQHISTDIKSLFRLARSAGISLEEFDRIVQTELEVLPLMDME
jgi:hypothetical protein